MKRSLSILSTISLLTLSTSMIVVANQSNIVINSNNYYDNENLDNQLEKNWEWKNVEIDHSINTPVSGTHEREGWDLDLFAVADVSWENVFMKSQRIITNGYFALHTYKNASYFNELLLKLDSDSSNQNYRVWVGKEENDQWAGWGHQNSKIKLTITAKYIKENELTSLIIQSYIYARTAGSVHECSTTSQVRNIKFVV